MITTRDGRFRELKRLEREWMGRDNGRTEDSGHSAVTEEWIEGMNYGIAWAKHIEQREANANPKGIV